MEIQIIDGDHKDDFPLWEVHIKKKKKKSNERKKEEKRKKGKTD